MTSSRMNQKAKPWQYSICEGTALRIRELSSSIFFQGSSVARNYVEKYGHSNVRTMHAHVEINPAARDAWLNCMGIAIDRVGLPAKTKVQMMEHFTRVAQMLVNRS